MAEMNPILAALQAMVGQQGNQPIPGMPGAPFMAQPPQQELPPGTIVPVQQQTGDPSQGGHDWQQMALDAMRPQPQREKTWADTGKEMMAPLAVGLLKSLVHPRYGGFLGGLREGIDSGVGLWQHQRDQAAASQAAAQRNAAARAGMLAKMGNTQAMEHLRQAQMEQTGELKRESLDVQREGHQMQNTMAQQRESDLMANSAANRAQKAALAQFVQDSENRRAADANALRRDLAEMRKTSGGGGPPVKVLDLKTGQAALVPREQAMNSERFHPWSAQAEKDISTLNKADGAIGGLQEAVNRMKDIPDSSPMGKLWDYNMKYKMLGGKGLSDEKMNMMSWVDLAQQQFLGAAGTLSGNRSARVLTMITNHLPKQQDSMATIKSKLKTMTLAMDLAKDAEGYGGDLIRDPAGLAAAKEQMKISKDASQLEYEQKFGKYLAEKYPEEADAAKAAATAPTATPAADPYSGLDWDALEKKYPKGQ